MAIKEILKSNFFIKLILQTRDKWKFIYYNCSCSQEGEDMILKKLLSEEYKRDISQIKGFYTDIGAHHPFRLSNTYYFYKLGWHGINIDAMPNSMIPFNKYRSSDINLEIGIADKRSSLDYYIFEEPTINSFDKTLSELRISEGQKLIQIKKIDTFPLSEILEKYLSENQTIDFLTMDIEGLDEIVLASNNWGKYRPKFIVVEAVDFNLLTLSLNSLHLSMNTIDYTIVAKLFNSIIYKDMKI